MVSIDVGSMRAVRRNWSTGREENGSGELLFSPALDSKFARSSQASCPNNERAGTTIGLSRAKQFASTCGISISARSDRSRQIAFGYVSDVHG